MKLPPGVRLRRRARTIVDRGRAVLAGSETGAVLRSVGMITVAEAGLLRELAGAVPSGACIVEVGSYRGRSAVALAQGAARNGVAVYAVDPHEAFTGVNGASFGPADRRAFYRAMLRTGAADTVRLVNLPSTVAAAGWHLPVGLLWVDGDHRAEAVRADWDAWAPHLTPTARVALDDSTQPGSGPHQLIQVMTSRGWAVDRIVGKVTVLAPEAGG